MHAEGLVSDDVVNQLGLQPRDAGDVCEDSLTSLLYFGETCLMVHREPALDGGDRADHLLSVNLVGASDAPDASSLVSDEGLVAELAYEVLGTEREAGGLWRAHVLGGDALEVGAHSDVLAEIVEWVNLTRGVNGYGHTMLARYLDAVLKGQDVGVGFLLDGVEVDGGGVRADGVFQVFACGSLVRAELHELSAGCFEAAVVPIPLPTLDEELVLHSGGVGELLDSVIIVPGHDSGGGQSQSGTRSGRYPGGGYVGHVRDGLAGLLLQFHKRDVGHARGLHRLLDLGRGSRTA